MPLPEIFPIKLLEQLKSIFPEPEINAVAFSLVIAVQSIPPEPESLMLISFVDPFTFKFPEPDKTAERVEVLASIFAFPEPDKLISKFDVLIGFLVVIFPEPPKSTLLISSKGIEIFINS